VVFLCENNQYAISLRRDRQTAAETIASKAEGYGMPGTLVDGNDLFAVFDATKEAADRARRGDGPTLIEALTYRVGPHTTSDDPKRYRDASEEAEWRERDPIKRVRAWLEERGAWDDEWLRALEASEAAAIEAAVEAAEAVPVQDAGGPFEAMFAQMTPQLREQQRELLESLGEVAGQS
jgi:pyruvate dehydrogenase E1 component alpha subunit